MAVLALVVGVLLGAALGAALAGTVAVRRRSTMAAALAGTFNIRSIPTFYVIKGGKIQGNLSGYADSMQQDIRDLIEKALA